MWFGLAVHESGSDRRCGVAHRKIVDEQLGDTVLDFLSANGIGDVQRNKSSDHLAVLMLADRPRVIITTTMQKSSSNLARYFGSHPLVAHQCVTAVGHGSCS